MILVLPMLFLMNTASAKKNKKTKYTYPKEAIVQSIIDHKLLQPFLHPESKGRVPLVISDHLIGKDFKLKKFNQPVKIVSEAEAKGAFLRFTSFDCKNGNYCNIAFEYLAEGVVGFTGAAIKRDGSHKLEKTDISKK